MEGTQVATFGSPSAVRAWAAHSPNRPIAACIGGTSQRAAENQGFTQIVAPSKPGVEGWAKVTAEAVKMLHESG